VVTHEAVEPLTRDTATQLQDVTAAARPNLNNGEIQDLEELTEYGDIFAMDSDDYGRTDRVYYSIGTGGARLIRQHRRRLPLAKQADAGEILEDMQRRWVSKSQTSPRYPRSRLEERGPALLRILQEIKR
jgi:hypothetical protein